jgi:hypothetical protein
MKAVIVELEVQSGLAVKKLFIYDSDFFPSALDTPQRIIHDRLIGLRPIPRHFPDIPSDSLLSFGCSLFMRLLCASRATRRKPRSLEALGIDSLSAQPRPICLCAGYNQPPKDEKQSVFAIFFSQKRGRLGFKEPSAPRPLPIPKEKTPSPPKAASPYKPGPDHPWRKLGKRKTQRTSIFTGRQQLFQE